jgi:Rod binding domain-containing protein
MTVPLKSVSTGVGDNTDLDQLKRAGNGTISSEKARLRKATKDFESYFIYQMLKTMRQTVPKDPTSESSGLSSSMGKDTFTDMFDMEVAQKASFGGHNSISELLYRSMEKLVDAKYEQEPSEVTIKPLKSILDTPMSPAPIELKTETLVPLTRKVTEPIPLKKTSGAAKATPISEISSLHQTAPATKTAPTRQASSVGQTTAIDPIRARFGHIIDQAARETNLDSSLIHSVIQAESNGNPNAVSPAGAKGLMQLADSTAQELEVSDPFDPAQNIRAGSRYLRRMLDRFGDLDMALAAYNAGPGNVAKYDGVPPFKETVNYVRKITESLEAGDDK